MKDDTLVEIELGEMKELDLLLSWSRGDVVNCYRSASKEGEPAIEIIYYPDCQRAGVASGGRSVWFDASGADEALQLYINRSNGKQVIGVASRINGIWTRKGESVEHKMTAQEAELAASHEMSNEECRLAIEILESVDLMRLTGMLGMSKTVESNKKKRTRKPAYSIQFCKRCAKR